ncbi:ferredoxin--NADP reductase [Glaciimonas immobilis]|uniref:ferredoxin--NADP(+) reductase n=1 Tax=Glaciimonas immobilis TaxID=728004 RepID=A0A840RMU1_9BURK|nr:ferredoxin--NADP reductase [Glaciimonas immobilis]KAF3999478.1 ferredoxin--NADP reductase [Glaciimonas immobilis]MBB5198995.1 ferredoxin--NADP+ reductase [Glaciimonas immobilis]
MNSSAYFHETVTKVHHWTDRLFSFEATRSHSLRFENGQFTMIGLPNPESPDGAPVLRAYSFASANYEENLEFLSIKMQDGALTSRLQKVQPGDTLLVGKKPTGSLLLSNLLQGKRLYLLGTGTGLAPFLSIIKDPETYDLYEKIILVHCVRKKSDLVYPQYLKEELPNHEFLGAAVRQKLIYYPTVTREPFPAQGRITELIQNQKLFTDIALPAIDPEYDRVMICGSMAMLNDLRTMLVQRKFAEGAARQAGHFVIERSFVD